MELHPAALGWGLTPSRRARGIVLLQAQERGPAFYRKKFFLLVALLPYQDEPAQQELLLRGGILVDKRSWLLLVALRWVL